MKKITYKIKCRCCNQTVEAERDMSTFTCARCGAVSILPKGIDEETVALYSDAYRYLGEREFYNAIRLFEVLIKQSPTAAAHLGAFLARYGVSGERDHERDTYIPHCFRTCREDIYDDEDLKKAHALAKGEEKELISSLAQFIAGEQERLQKKERAALLEEKKREEARLSQYDELAEAEKRIKEKEDKKRAEIEAEKEREAEIAAKRAADRLARIERNRKKERARKTAVISSVAAVLIIALSVFTFSFLIPQIKYSSALSKIDAGNIGEGVSILRDLGSFKDSEKLVKKYAFYGLKAGDSVYHGFYEQDNSSANGTEEIEWIVLECDGESALLISKYILEVGKYNEKNTSVTWETCTLRTWLNDKFFNSAFLSAEQQRILTASLENKDNGLQKTDGGNDTEDKVFILSADEAERLIAGKAIGEGKATAYALSKDIYIDDKNAENKPTFNCWYWLRTPGSSQSSAVKMDYDSTVNYKGAAVDYSKYGIRPVIRVSVDG